MRFKQFAILSIAALTAACSAPMSQSATPTAPQPAAVLNGHVSPDGPCNFLKMEPPARTVSVHQQVGITPILRLRASGKCEGYRLPATWASSGGNLLIRKKGKLAIFSSKTAGGYTVSAAVQYGSQTYYGQTAITVNP
jgi:hypothetical protein